MHLFFLQHLLIQYVCIYTYMFLQICKVRHCQSWNTCGCNGSRQRTRLPIADCNSSASSHFWWAIAAYKIKTSQGRITKGVLPERTHSIYYCKQMYVDPRVQECFELMLSGIIDYTCVWLYDTVAIPKGLKSSLAAGSTTNTLKQANHPLLKDL